MGRRALTSAITLTVLMALLISGAVWGWRALFAELPDAPVVTEEPTPTCTPEQIRPGERLRSTQVRVSVFNGGTRSGLAGQVMDQLLDRRFLPGDVGNAPTEVRVGRVQIWTSVEDDPKARLVARQFGKRTRIVVTDQDLGPGIDVLVGDDFSALRRAPQAIQVREPQEVCVPVEETLAPLD